MTIHPQQILPAPGFAYRRRADGMPAAVLVFHARLGRVVLVDAGGGKHWETIEGFWNTYVHADIYEPADDRDPARN